ncbi:MAG: phage Gp37/Gp68 family protein [Desulfovibrionaceae bacterium]|nr:phage Gp37/Gp68 family protein [Desulfovibrionaceae bacterium]
MTLTSKIEWTDGTWNPITGCTPISAGCAHCYAKKMAPRLKGMGQEKYRNGFDVTCHSGELHKPLLVKKPQKIFPCSMSDMFHDEVPVEFIKEVFNIMGQAHWHTFQILTKRAERLSELSTLLPWPENVWCGVTIEADQYAHRVDLLKTTEARVKFVSLEPLLEPLPSLDYSGLDWIICGGESGPGARPMTEQWILDIRDKAVAHSVPFFFKQWGGRNKKLAGRLLEGRTWDEFPM